MEVHRILGHGFSEIVYKDALMLEAELKDISTEREKEFKIEYKKSYYNIPFLLILFYFMK
jgi:GxxExxY protein